MSLKSRNKPSDQFSMASMADIVFMLLIYFMLTSSVIIGIKVDLPQSSSQKPSEGKHAVTITKDLKFAWDQEIVPREEVPKLIEKILTDDNEDNDVITIRTDKQVTMEDVAFVMSPVAYYGGKIVFQTEKTFK